MPTIDMCRVLGIGVAVRVNTSTDRLILLIVSLCETPNRCSSSTTSRPKSLNATSLFNNLCVPITTSSPPDSSFFSTSFCSAEVLKRLRVSMRTGKPWKRFIIVA